MRISAMGPRPVENRLFTTRMHIQGGTTARNKFRHGILGNERIVYSMSSLWNTTILVDINVKISTLHIRNESSAHGLLGGLHRFFAKYLLYTGCVWQLRGIAFCITQSRCRQQKESLSPVPRAFASTDCSTTTDHVPRKCSNFMCRFFWTTCFWNKKPTIQKVSILYWGRDKSNPCTHPRSACDLAKHRLQLLLHHLFEHFQCCLATKALFTGTDDCVAGDHIQLKWSAVHHLVHMAAKFVPLKSMSFQSLLQNELFLVWALRLGSSLYLQAICIGFSLSHRTVFWDLSHLPSAVIVFPSPQISSMLVAILLPFRKN